MTTYPPVESLSARRLHERLVRDVVKNRATPLPWFIAAIDRIATLEGRGPEAAFRDFLEDCTSRGFPPSRMPMARATPEELARLGL